MFGNGYLGYRGTPCDATKEDYAACIVTDTYDNADGKWRELCNVPNGLYAALNVDGQPFKVTDATDYRRKLDLSASILTQEATSDSIRMKAVRFAAMDKLHLLAMRYEVTTNKDTKIDIVTGIDGDVWSINGEHFVEYNLSEEDGILVTHTKTKEFGIEVYVAESTSIISDADMTCTSFQDGKRICTALLPCFQQAKHSSSKNGYHLLEQ